MFGLAKGKLRRIYDETLEAAQELQRSEGGPFRLEPIDFGRRISIERDIEADDAAPHPNAIFDESGNFIIYPSILGIKVRCCFIFDGQIGYSNRLSFSCPAVS